MFKKNKYFALGMTLLTVIIASILFYVVLTNIGIVFGKISEFVDILSSVLFGFAFAYLMNPVMMITERGVRRLFRSAICRLPFPVRRMKVSSREGSFVCISKIAHLFSASA